jgi:hypothetical protein
MKRIDQIFVVNFFDILERYKNNFSFTKSLFLSLNYFLQFPENPIPSTLEKKQKDFLLDFILILIIEGSINIWGLCVIQLKRDILLIIFKFQESI